MVTQDQVRAIGGTSYRWPWVGEAVFRRSFLDPKKEKVLAVRSAKERMVQAGGTAGAKAQGQEEI